MKSTPHDKLQISSRSKREPTQIIYVPTDPIRPSGTCPELKSDIFNLRTARDELSEAKIVIVRAGVYVQCRPNPRLHELLPRDRNSFDRMKIVESWTVGEHAEVRRSHEIDAQPAETCERFIGANTPPVLYLRIVFNAADDQSGALVESKVFGDFFTGRKLRLTCTPVIQLVQRNCHRVINELGSSAITVVEHGNDVRQSQAFERCEPFNIPQIKSAYLKHAPRKPGGRARAHFVAFCRFTAAEFHAVEGAGRDADSAAYPKVWTNLTTYRNRISVVVMPVSGIDS
jgi:hypothetical protein